MTTTMTSAKLEFPISHHPGDFQVGTITLTNWSPENPLEISQIQISPCKPPLNHHLNRLNHDHNYLEKKEEGFPFTGLFSVESREEEERDSHRPGKSSFFSSSLTAASAAATLPGSSASTSSSFMPSSFAPSSSSSFSFSSASPSSPFVLVVSPLLPLILAPMHKAELVIHFAPTHSGEFTADLHVVASSKDFPEFTQLIKLEGGASMEAEAEKKKEPSESAELQILKRMEERMIQHQQESKRHLELISERLGRLENHVFRNPTFEFGRTRPPMQPARIPLEDEELLPHEPDFGQPILGGTFLSSSWQQDSSPPHPFPVLEPSFSVASALSSPQPHTSNTSSRSQEETSRSFGDISLRTPISKERERTRHDPQIQATNPFPPSLQKYTDEMTNRTVQEPFPPTPMTQEKAMGFRLGDDSFKLSLNEYSLTKF